MRTARLFLFGIGIGSAVTFFFDPRAGSRRRALVRDKAVRLAGEVKVQVDAGMRDLSHRVHGLVSSAWGAAHTFSSREPVLDDVLQARVRSAMGRVCSHPHAIHVTVERGCVELTGLVLSEERVSVVRQVARVSGVRIIKDLLEPHAREEGIAMLQGPPRHPRPAIVRGLTSPAGRLVLGSAALVLVGAWIPSLLVPLGTLVGLGVAARNEEQARARRERSLERRGARRTRPRVDVSRQQVTTTVDEGPVRSTNGHPAGATPNGHSRPMPPRPQ